MLAQQFPLGLDGFSVCLLGVGLLNSQVVCGAKGDCMALIIIVNSYNRYTTAVTRLTIGRVIWQAFFTIIGSLLMIVLLVAVIKTLN